MNSTPKSWKKIDGGIAAPRGFYADGVKAGVKYQDKYDVALVLSEIQASAAGLFTRNIVKAHPLLLTQKHLADGKAQVVVVNSGNANACMGKAGDIAALQMAEAAAQALGISQEDIIVASTGVIGQELPLDKVLPGIKEAAASVLADNTLNGDLKEKNKQLHARQAALAIMTTDTTVKESAMELETGQGVVRLGIMAKGSGMIHPNMGTMLCFITTDAEVEPAKLKALLTEAAEQSFNMVTIDGDTSTNDMVVILANGRSGVTPAGDDWESFARMVKEACCEMAMAIARDGEGASKFLETRVSGGKTLEDARKIARSVCSSNLVKSAMYGQDANWGRILVAAGYSGACFDPNKINIYLNSLQVAKDGQGLKFSENEAFERLKNTDILIEVKLEDGDAEAVAWGCDLTHQYVDINANYRT